jgi:copper chaperone
MEIEMEIRFSIKGMSCGHCVMAVKKALDKLNISSADVKIGSASVQYDESKISSEQIKKEIENTGYEIVEEEQISKE